MEFLVVEKVSRFIGRKDVNADDSNCFHGVGQRSGVWHPNEPDAWANTEGVERLVIARIAGQQDAEITKPASQLVITGDIAESVDWGRWVKLERVGKVKAIDIDYEIGPDGWPRFIERYHGKLLSELLREQFVSAESVRHNLFELRVWRLLDVIDSEPTRQRMRTCCIELADDFELIRQVGELVQKFRLLWHRGRIIVGETLHGALLPFFDRRFFNVHVIKVTKNRSVL